MASATKGLLLAAMFLISTSTSVQISHSKARSSEDSEHSRLVSVMAEISRLMAVKYGTSYGESLGNYNKTRLKLTLYQAQVVLDRLSSELGIPARRSSEMPSDVRNGFKSVARKWNMPIRYAFQDGMYTNSDKNEIRRGLKMWADATCVRFEEASLSSLTGEFDHIVYTKGDGCYSNLGRVGGRQVISLGDGCIEAATVAHEIGHALGLVHEQNRSDRDSYVRIDINNVEEDNRYNFDIEPDDINFRAKYDYFSIMHYSANAFAIDRSRPTMVRIDGSTSMGSSSRLSESDISRVNQHYQCGTTPPVVTTTESPAITWHSDGWAEACDFSGGDMKSVKVAPNRCGPACVENPPCSHFTWTSWEGGTCFLKSGPISKSSAFFTGDISMICGILSSAPSSDVIVWNGHWAYGCDFEGNDLKSVKVPPELCGPACDENPPCSHFVWTNWQGGTCFLKSGSTSKCSAFATADKSMVCGVRPALDRNSIGWDSTWAPVYWANGCDFKGNDIKWVLSPADRCGPTCDENPECTHFTWSNWQDGTCFHKSGIVSRSDAFPTCDQSMVCGINGRAGN